MLVMTKVKIFKSNNKILKYIIDGHAGYDEYGSDIVCASISMLGITTYNSLEVVCGIPEDDMVVVADDKSGYLMVSIPKELRDDLMAKAQVVLQTLEIGIIETVRNYPDYITLEYGEV